jgi:hypothetical protein
VALEDPNLTAALGCQSWMLSMQSGRRLEYDFQLTSDRMSKRVVDAGFTDVAKTALIRTTLGTLRLFRARNGAR